MIGKYYEDELSFVGKEKKMPNIEKILKIRKGMILVKWKGYDSKHSSWIPDRKLKDELDYGYYTQDETNTLKRQYKDLSKPKK